MAGSSSIVKLFRRASFPSVNPQWHEKSDEVIENLDSTEDWEAGEQTHRASDQAELSFQRQFDIPLNLVVAGGDKVDLDQVQWRKPFGRGWKRRQRF